MSTEQLLSAVAENPGLLPRLLVVCEQEARYQAETIDTPEKAQRAFAPLLEGYREERLAVMALDTRYRLIEAEVLTQGSARFTVVDPRQIFRWALTRDVVPGCLLVAHNHPSGRVEPSGQDREVTETLWRAGRAIGIPLVDHLILAAGRWTSLAEEGAIPGRDIVPYTCTTGGS